MKKGLACFLALCALSVGAQAEGANGVYESTAKGFGGDVTVSVTLEGGRIVDVKAVGDKETAGVGSRAIDELPGKMIEANSTDVEAVTGATITSGAIKAAAAQALAQAAGTETATEPVHMTPGTYRGEAKGMNGTIVVDVTVTEDAIADIQFVETIPRENELIDTTHWLSGYLVDLLDETPQIFCTVTDRLPQRILEAQSLAVDAVAGSTVSSNGFVAAVRSALTQAGAPESAFNTPVAKVEAQETYDADVVVIGGGTSGAAAAASAAEHGVNVVLIEKSARLGGTGALSSEPMTFGAKIQLDAGLEYDQLKQDTFDAWLSQNHWAVNGRMVSQFINASGETGDWLIEKGFKFEKGTTTDTTLHYVDASIGTMTQKTSFEQMCADVDTILYETTAHDLIVKDGSVVGVKATRYDGTQVTVNAKAVIVCSGGFGGSEELMTKYNGGYFKLLGLTQNVGEGLMMMTAAGAQEYHIGGACAHQTEVPVQVSGFNAEDTAIPYTICNVPTLMRLSKNGQRFMNEDEKSFSPTASSNYIYSNGPEYFTLLTQAQVEVLREKGTAGLGMDKQCDPSFYTFPAPADDPMENIQAVLDAAEKIGMVYKADTLDELAEITGMDAQILKRNVADYNAFCANGVDTDYYKNPNYLYSYDEEGPFYAVVGCIMSYNSLGGVKVDELFRVQDTQDQAITGLYAAGVDSIGAVLDGTAYPDLFGVALGWGFTSGRMAGVNAAAFALAE